MSLACPSCGISNPPDTRYCEDCGVELIQPAAPLEPPPPRPPLPMAAASVLRGTSPPTRITEDVFVRPRSSPPVSGTRLQLTEAFLVHLGTGARLEVPVEKSIAYIGRANDDFPPDIDVSHLPDSDIVSRIHAAVHIQETTFFLEDAGSSNGTFLNDQPLPAGARHRRLLQPGDTFYLGKEHKVGFTFDLAT
ncbi:FHA domain-containing protein [Anthocerotibacter panamensis]|uniref:FHA domain-containing protein n=1 Tax=Anthocerotibacter panamensis TaxID=2857077 RepID=UPI001C405914|nr:FHA domain-containing protein [Anthocerotibacter panamensis]